MTKLKLQVLWKIMQKELHNKKTPSCSWIVVDKMVHVFLFGEKSYP